LFYQRVLAQQPKDKNKIYSLHEPDVYVIAKGKDHKQYEYGNLLGFGTLFNMAEVVNTKTTVFNLFNISSMLGNIVVFCQFVKPIDNLDG
jgi:hypothetical protein